MVDIMNKTLYTNHLQSLYDTSRYITLYNSLDILPPDKLFSSASRLLFDILTIKDRISYLYVDNFIEICLDKIIDRVHEAKTMFNIVMSIFDMFFTPINNKISNKL